MTTTNAGAGKGGPQGDNKITAQALRAGAGAEATATPAPTLTFDDLHLHERILRAVHDEGYTTPTPIQAQAIPLVMSGRDVLGCAQTGTGKTAAFSLPILHRLLEDRAAAAGPPAPAAGAGDAGAAPERSGGAAHPKRKGARHHAHARPVRALVLAPTRELALQIDESLRTYGRHASIRTACVFGGVSQGPQTRALETGVDVLVATPGRLLDLMGQGLVDLSGVKVFVLDEADRMLDMGFIDPIRRIVSHVPPRRQTLLFSATMPGPIRSLAASLLKEPASVTVTPVSSTPDRVDQAVIMVPRKHKPEVLVSVLNAEHVDRALVFTRTKHGADRVARHLSRAGVRADAIHGDKRQNQRQRTLEDFRSGRTWVLVATDIAARGIDVEGVSHVFNYDVPHEPETYVHRIGRTARAGASGRAVSLCDPEGDERGFLKGIERLMKRPIAVIPFPAEALEHKPGWDAGARAGPRREQDAEGAPSGGDVSGAERERSHAPGRGHAGGRPRHDWKDRPREGGERGDGRRGGPHRGGPGHRGAHGDRGAPGGGHPRGQNRGGPFGARDRGPGPTGGRGGGGRGGHGGHSGHGGHRAGTGHRAGPPHAGRGSPPAHAGHSSHGGHRPRGSHAPGAGVTRPHATPHSSPSNHAAPAHTPPAGPVSPKPSTHRKGPRPSRPHEGGKPHGGPTKPTTGGGHTHGGGHPPHSPRPSHPKPRGGKPGGWKRNGGRR